MSATGLITSQLHNFTRFTRCSHDTPATPPATLPPLVIGAYPGTYLRTLAMAVALPRLSFSSFPRWRFLPSSGFRHLCTSSPSLASEDTELAGRLVKTVQSAKPRPGSPITRTSRNTKASDPPLRDTVPRLHKANKKNMKQRYDWQGFLKMGNADYQMKTPGARQSSYGKLLRSGPFHSVQNKAKFVRRLKMLWGVVLGEDGKWAESIKITQRRLSTYLRRRADAYSYNGLEYYMRGLDQAIAVQEKCCRSSHETIQETQAVKAAMLADDVLVHVPKSVRTTFEGMLKATIRQLEEPEGVQSPSKRLKPTKRKGSFHLTFGRPLSESLGLLRSKMFEDLPLETIFDYVHLWRAIRLLQDAVKQEEKNGRLPLPHYEIGGTRDRLQQASSRAWEAAAWAMVLEVEYGKAERRFESTENSLMSAIRRFYQERKKPLPAFAQPKSQLSGANEQTVIAAV
ncbi:hypothetical protein F4780DRAFT_76455 [Xylariomycetidae sp. FL0641]|nr:hypothetical protein F4780DRAFT_76455 [Xylariomycetidae sp. FL0641]